MIMQAEVNLAEDLVPIADMGPGSKYVEAVVESGRPKLVTKEGVGVAVIVDVGTFEALKGEAAARELLHDLRATSAQADAGDVIEHDEVVRQLRARFAGRVPPEVQARLEAH
jgi:prevent-host-death family protein